MRRLPPLCGRHDSAGANGRVVTSARLGTSPGVFERHGILVERATALQRLAAWAEDWDRLATLAPQRRPRLSHAWIASLLHHARDNEAEVSRDFGLEPTGDPWCCLFASRGNELLGVMPLVAVRRKALFGVQRRAAVPPHGPRETCGDLVLAPGPDGVLALAALVSVAAQTFPQPMWLELDQVCDSSPTLAAVRRGVPGMRAVIEAVRPVSYLPIHGSFDEYLARLSKKLSEEPPSQPKTAREACGSRIRVRRGPRRLVRRSIASWPWKPPGGRGARGAPSDPRRARRVLPVPDPGAVGPRLARAGLPPCRGSGPCGGDQRAIRRSHARGQVCLRRELRGLLSREHPARALRATRLRVRRGRAERGERPPLDAQLGDAAAGLLERALFPRSLLSLLLGYLPARLRRSLRGRSAPDSAHPGD